MGLNRKFHFWVTLTLWTLVKMKSSSLTLDKGDTFIFYIISPSIDSSQEARLEKFFELETLVTNQWIQYEGHSSENVRLWFTDHNRPIQSQRV